MLICICDLDWKSGNLYFEYKNKILNERIGNFNIKVRIYISIYLVKVK